MKEDNYFWKYEYEPGKKLKNRNNIIKGKPLVSIITSYYNANEYMWQTINCVLNQTFQSWEWIIVDDGSTEKEAVEYLKKVENVDHRIKIYHKKNEGLALGRDYAIKFATTNYILPLDADDLIEETYIETLYWTMETNKNAAWAFTNSVGFGKYIYLSDIEFDCEKMKIDNHITATALIRKEKILNLGGYGKAKRYVNEDWHLWLRMLADEQFPVQVGFYGFWYRRREESLLTNVNNEKNQKYRLKMRDLKVEADKIKKHINAIMYPKTKESALKSREKLECNINKIEILNNNKKSDIYILPYLGTDKIMYKKIKKAAKEKNIYVITMENTKQSPYFYRQRYEEFCIVYDLTTFIDSKYWMDFIQYVINSRNVDNVYVSNIKEKEELKKKIPIIEIKNCKNNKIIYQLKILNYKFRHLLIIRGIRKILKNVMHKKY